MSNKRVIILGASRYYSKSIAAAKANGYFVVALDRNPHAEGLKDATIGIPCDILDKTEVLRIARHYNVNGIVPVNDYGVPTAAYVARCLGLPGITEESALWATNKEAMRKRWSSLGVPCPRFLVANTIDDIRVAAQSIGFPCILKPAHGIGGASRGVIVVQTPDELDAAINFTQGFYADKTTLIEEFVESEFEHSAEVLIIDGTPHVLTVSDQIKAPLPYRVAQNLIYPSRVTGKRLENLKEVVTQAVRALNLSIGAAHVELASTKDGGFVLFELGARCGGGGIPEPIVSYTTGVQQFVEAVRLAVNDPPCSFPATRQRACNYHFILLKPGVIKSLSGVTAMKQSEGVLDAELFVKEGDTVVPVTTGVERSGFIITGAETRDRAYELGLKAEANLTIEYY